MQAQSVKVLKISFYSEQKKWIYIYESLLDDLRL